MSTPAGDTPTEVTRVVTDEEKQKTLSTLPAPVQKVIAKLNTKIAENNALVAQIHASDPKDVEKALDAVVETHPDLKTQREHLATLENALAAARTKARNAAEKHLPKRLTEDEKPVVQEQIKTLVKEIKAAVDNFESAKEWFPELMNDEMIQFIKTELLVRQQKNGKIVIPGSTTSSGGNTSDTPKPRTKHVFFAEPSDSETDTLEFTRAQGPEKKDKDGKATGDFPSTFSALAGVIRKTYKKSVSVPDMQAAWLKASGAQDMDHIPDVVEFEYNIGTESEPKNIVVKVHRS